uniref:WRC domain-containing protein n=1 Tax=Oryza barthii TaxID=65489 RepID=A0A0D3GE13_9ORYZ
MRIRRRPQSLQALSSLHPSSDPSTAPQPPPRNHGRYWLSVDKVDEEEKKSERLHLHPNADLADDDSSAAMRAALPLFPQDNAVVECSKIRPRGGAQQGAADGHRSLENGHYSKPDPAIRSTTGERLVNGVVRAMPVAANAKEETKNDGGGGGGAKKRRGPAVLMEGSRCSRVNGRGWRCSQPTLVGYSLCEHHLGKGRMRSVTGGGGGRGGDQASSAAPSTGRRRRRRNPVRRGGAAAQGRRARPESYRASLMRRNEFLPIWGCTFWPPAM